MRARTSNCVARIAITSSPTWRSARIAGSPPERRPGHRGPHAVSSVRKAKASTAPPMWSTRRGPRHRCAVPATSGSWARWALESAVAAAIAVVVSMLITPGVAPYKCPPDCGTAADRDAGRNEPALQLPTNSAFSVNYPGEGTAYKATFNPDGCGAGLRRRRYRHPGALR